MNNVFPMRTIPGALWRPGTSPRQRPAPASKGITPMTAATDNAGQRQGGRFVKGMRATRAAHPGIIGMIGNHLTQEYRI